VLWAEEIAAVTRGSQRRQSSSVGRCGAYHNPNAALVAPGVLALFT